MRKFRIYLAILTVMLPVWVTGRASYGDTPAKPTPNARFGNTLYHKPEATWKSRTENNRLIFATDLPAPDFCELTLFPGGPLKGDFRKAFDDAVTHMLQERGVVKIEDDSGVLESSAAEGFPVLQRTLTCEAKDFHTKHWFLAANSGGRFDMISFETSGDEGWNAHYQEALSFFLSVKMANSLPPEKIPASLRKGDTSGSASTSMPTSSAKPAESGLTVGSQIEAYQYTSSKWLDGKITEIDNSGQHKGPFHVVFSDPKLTFTEEWLGSKEIRAAGLYTNQYKNGARVDIISRLDRGTVIEVNGFNYKIHYDGCKAYWDSWYDGSDLRPVATLSPGSAEVKFLIGNWRMFQPGAPNTVVRDGQVYREYGFGAKAPPLQILANGTYVWKVSFDKPAIHGKWTPSAKIATNDKHAISQYLVAGILIKDDEGQSWRVYREGKTGNRITLRCLCQGLEMMGTRQ